MQGIEDIRTVTPEQRLYNANGGAVQLMYCKDKEVLIEGPAGTGKTRAVLEKAHLCCQKYPGARVLACRKTRASMTESVLVTFEEKVVVTGDPLKNGPKRGGRKAYHYPNGSELVLCGLDDPDRIMSTEYDMVLVFEATEATQDDWEKLGSRLRNNVMPFQQLIGDCNPGTPSHWLNRRCQEGKTTRIHSRHEDNPTVTQDYLDRLSSTLTGARRLRLLEGRWAAQEGLVYPQYDPAVHLLTWDKFRAMHGVMEIPKEWRRVRVVDFGYRNPFVCQWWAEDGDGRWYRYREIYMTERTTRAHAAQITELSAGENIETSVVDHDAEDTATLTECGIASVRAVKDVARGIQEVQEMLQLDAIEKPRLYFMADALVEVDEKLRETKFPYCTEQEFEGYVWALAPDGKQNKEAVVKENDHGMDTTRYLAMYSKTRRSEFQ